MRCSGQKRLAGRSFYAQVVDAKILNIHTVNCNLTQLHIVIARQQIHQCRLAGAGLTDKCNGLSFGHHQIDVLQHFALAVVTEGEVLKFNPVIHPVQRQRVYRFLNGVLGFQYFVVTDANSIFADFLGKTASAFAPPVLRWNFQCLLAILLNEKES